MLQGDLSSLPTTVSSTSLVSHYNATTTTRQQQQQQHQLQQVHNNTLHNNGSLSCHVNEGQLSDRNDDNILHNLHSSSSSARDDQHNLTHYVENEAQTSNHRHVIVETYAGDVEQDCGSTLATFPSNDVQEHYTVSSQPDSQQLMSYSDTTQTEPSGLVQFSNGVVQSNGALQYSDGRDGLTITTLPLPLLADNNLVNLQLLPDGFGLETSGLEASNVMLRNGYSGEGSVPASISIVNGSTDDGSDNADLNLLDNRDARPGEEASIPVEEENVTYLDGPDGSGVLSSSGSAGGTQYLQIAGAGGQTVSVPLSFLSTSNGLSFLQQLGVVRVEAEQSSMFLPQFSSDNNISASQQQQQTGVLASSNSLQVVDVGQDGADASSILGFENEIPLLDNNAYISNETTNSAGSSVTVVASSSAAVSQSTNNSYSANIISNSRNIAGRTAPGRHPTVNSNISTSNKCRTTRVLGSGPLAISAQGVVQQVGGRRVTVLPRPEDLQRLK